MSDGTTTAAMCTGTYDACQCLCCSTDRRSPTCYFPTLGETVDEIRATYEASKNPANCGARELQQCHRPVCVLHARRPRAALERDVRCDRGT